MAESGAPSGTASEYASSEMPASIQGEATPAEPVGFPPYPPYATEPAPPSVADTIIAGRDIRNQHKSFPKTPVHPPPKPARPRGPKATDVKLSRRAMRAHARCLRRHGAVLTDRLERMAKPRRRDIIGLWRDYAYRLPAETIARLRSILDADEPFKPDQAYEFFINLRKTKRKTAAKTRDNQMKKDVMAICADKRFIWARNATVAFAKGIQLRLSPPGCYDLTDNMLRLSNIILREICGYMRMKTPSRRCCHPKARFMMEMADKVAVWIDDVLTESDERMLMMDFDEDDDVIGADEAGDTGFADNFLNMMGGGGLLVEPKAAYLKFSGPMLEAFLLLTEAMTNKGDQQLLQHGKFTQTYEEGADELKQATDFDATDFNPTLAVQLQNDLSSTAKPVTPSKLANEMNEIVVICSNYLSQYAEYNKDKGPAFKLLVKTMNAKPNELLYQKEKARRTYGKAAKELQDSKGLESDHDDPNLSQAIHSNLSKLVAPVTPADLKIDMNETLDLCSKYLSQCAIDEIERGPAFDLLIKELEAHGGAPFTPEHKPLANRFAAAYTLKSAPGLCSAVPHPETVPVFRGALHKAVDPATPKNLKKDMNDVIERCSNYLSAFIRDRGKALELLLKEMKKRGTQELIKRNNYSMNYATGATDTEHAPLLIPFVPVKDIAIELRDKLAKDTETSTPPDLKLAMKTLVQDVGRYLSQVVAMRSGIAGARYPLNFLTAVKKSLGSRSLFKYKSYGQTYSDAADVIKYAGPLEYDPKCEELQHQISSEMLRGVSTRVAHTITSDLTPTMTDASKHLAKVGTEKGEALDYVVKLMKDEGKAPLGQLQGYEQTYEDGARRIENAPSLKNDKVEKAAYETVKEKLTTLTEKKPNSTHAKHLPGVVDDASKFLSSPFPETDAEKRRVLADLMARKENEILGQEGLYKLTYTEGGEEVMNAPVGVTTSNNEAKKVEVLGKINTVIPDKKMQDTLKDPAQEGAAHITDLIKGRGQAMQVIHDELQKDKDKDFLSVGKFKKTQGQTAEMLEKAEHFGGEKPVSPVLYDKVSEKLKALPQVAAAEKTQGYMTETSHITSQYVAGKATKESGLSAKDLAAMDAVGGAAGGAAGGAGVSSAAGVPGPSATDTKGPSAVAPAKAQSPQSGETEEERRRRQEEEARRKAEEEARRKVEEEARRKAEEERRAKEAAARKRAEADTKRQGGTDDSEREAALAILHKQLRSRGGEVFYKQPHTEVSHSQASDWLKQPPVKVDKTVKESPDTARLHKKFERRLSSLVAKVTPTNMVDTMQDVIIESSRMLSEYFVTNNYKALVREALISEMQKRGNEILIELDGAAETFFFAAQRLKKAKTLEVKEPCTNVAYRLTKKLDDMIRCRSMARKLTSTMKDHIKDAADYLSELVTKPDDYIEAYVSLLDEMEAAGDALLIEGNIPKSYKDAAAYLRQLTTFEDRINLSNSGLQSAASSKLKGTMRNVTARGYTQSVMDEVINNSTKLLVSYIMLQGEKTEVLKIMIQQMEQAGENVLLRHGNIRKTFSDGADLLRGKNTDQLKVTNVDPVVARKIQIKLHNLMHDCTPDKYSSLIDDVIEDTTMYLAVHFLRPQYIQVCKCMKNVFVQCELWCDDILRRVTRPCCKCSRLVSTQALRDLAPAPEPLRLSPTSSKAYAPGIEISLTECPAQAGRNMPPACSRRQRVCPARQPTDGCKNATTSYVLYSTLYNQRSPFGAPKISQQQPASSNAQDLSSLYAETDMSPALLYETYPVTNVQPLRDEGSEPVQGNRDASDESTEYYTPPTTESKQVPKPEKPFWQSATTMYAKIQTHEQLPQQGSDITKSSDLYFDSSNVHIQGKSGFNSPGAPIVTTDQMSDWHAMMVSLMWNVQAWRNWIQEYFNRALSHTQDTGSSPAELEERWAALNRRISTEALQWRQYNKFSRQLALRLALRYRDKQIVSPTRATVKTALYMECQKEMLEIIDMFYKWTHWLSAVVKETNLLHATGDIPLHELRWKHFKEKIEEHEEDWVRYNTHWKISWEHKYRTLSSGWLPSWESPGPVWVVSACGAVPSGAVAAGVHDAEVVWVARTAHKCNVLPAALHPSKLCCLVYADGTVYHYTKYQVLCNARVKWVAWRAGEVGARAVRVASGVYVGRVHYRRSHLLGAVNAPSYRCHVVIFGRPFAFNCYELLVLADDDDR